VVLSAPAGSARVRLTEIAAATRNGAGSQVASVQAGRTLVVPVAAPRGARRGTPFAIVITPLAGSGPLYAARVQTQGQNAVVSIIPAVSAPATIALPPVRGSYDAISP
jgi:mRNA-degrading endonuclease toxin of MazEF toxin-antitoxin module